MPSMDSQTWQLQDGLVDLAVPEAPPPGGPFPDPTVTVTVLPLALSFIGEEGQVPERNGGVEADGVEVSEVNLAQCRDRARAGDVAVNAQRCRCRPDRPASRP